MSTADTISFNQSMYFVEEENESVQIVLVLSAPLPNIITVQVISSNLNTTGMYVNVFNIIEWLSILHNRE